MNIKTKRNMESITLSSENFYWNCLKNLSRKAKLSLIARLSNSLVEEEKMMQECDAHWADEFCGIWGNDSRSTEEILSEIRSVRSDNNPIITF